MMSPNGSVPPIYVPPGYVSQVSVPPPHFPAASSQRLPPLDTSRWRGPPSYQIAERRFRAPLLFIPPDHRRERSAAGPGATSAARLPPGGTLPSPSPAAAAPRSPACLHPAPRHDAPAAAPVHGHGRRRRRHELPVHHPVPSGSHLLRAG